MLVVDLTAQLERAHGRIAELQARLGRDSTNSSQPPSADSIAAKAKAAGGSLFAGAVADRKPGGQPSHRGSGLSHRPASRTGPRRWRRRESVPGCGAGWAQVWDTRPANGTR